MTRCFFLCVATAALVGCSDSSKGNKNDPKQAAKQDSSDQGKGKTAPAKAVLVLGELFVTTTGGDVKKVAGLKMWFTPISQGLKDSIRKDTVQIKKAWDDREATFNKFMEKHGNPPADQFDPKYAKVKKEYSEYEETVYDPAVAQMMTRVLGALKNQAHETRTDGDGRFALEMPKGKYLLWTEEVEILRKNLMWVKTVDVPSTKTSFILNQEDAKVVPNRPIRLNALANSLGVAVPGLGTGD